MNLVLLILAANISAIAAPFDCVPLQKIEQASGTCADNGKYADVGMHCLDKLEDFIKTQNAKAQFLLVQADKNTNAAQTGTFAGANASYKIAADAFTEALTAAKRAQWYVTSYISNIYFPEDFDAPREVIGDPVEFLNKSQCYAEPRDILKLILGDISKHISNLEAAKTAALKGSFLSTIQEGNLSQTKSLPTGSVMGGQGVSGGNAATGTGVKRPGIRPSDISGTKEEKKP